VCFHIGRAKKGRKEKESEKKAASNKKNGM
jgi:hypothetical protein